MRSFLLPMLWAALVPLVPLPTIAQPAEQPRTPPASLTLRHAQDAALSRHPELAAAALEVQATEAAQSQASARPNPTLSAEVEDARRSTRTTTILLNQPIELGGKRAARIGLAQRASDVAQADVVAKRAEVRAAVTTAYFDTLIAQERERLAVAALELSQRGRQIVTNRVTAGKVSPIEDTRAQVAVAGVQVELVKARSDLTSARQRLALAMGLQVSAVGTLDGTTARTPNPLPAEQIEERLRLAPATLRAQAEASRATAAVDVERSRQRPDLTVSLGVKRDGESGRQMAVVGLSIPLPVFDTNAGAVLEAQRRADKANAEIASARLRLEADARVAIEQMRAASEETDVLQREVVPGAQTAYDATVTGYELGKFGLNEVLDAQRTLLLAKTQVVQALAGAHRAAADLERLIGVPVSPIPSN